MTPDFFAGRHVRMTLKTQELLRVLSEMREHPLSPSQRELLEDTANRIEEDRLYVAVVGQFKRGKSTFLNAILGERVLPTGVLPLTNIITVLDAGPERELEVHFRNGTVRKDDVAHLDRYVAEKGNPNNEKSVAWVRLRHPAPLLAKGITLADTPGVGSLFESQTEVTKTFLPRIDAAFFLISADSPLSEGELAFLEDLRSQVRHLFVLLNKVDFVDVEGLAELRTFLAAQLRENLGEPELPLFAIAAKPALDARLRKDAAALEKTGLAAVETLLAGLSERDRAAVQWDANSRRALGIARALRTDALIESRSLKQPLDVLTKQIDTFVAGVSGLQERRFEAETLLEKELEGMIRALENDLDRIRKEYPPRIEQEIRAEATRRSSLGTKEFTDHLERLANERLVAHFEEWFLQTERHMESTYQTLTERHRRRLTSLLKELLDLGSSVFDVDLDEWELPEELSSEREFYYLEGETRPFFDLEGTVLSLGEALLPRSVGQNLVLKRLLSRLPQRVDANCGRIRYDMVRRVKDSFLHFRSRLRNLVEETAGGIEKAARSALEQRTQTREAQLRREEALRQVVAQCDDWIRTLMGQ
jgi:hypothetical protein